MTEMPVCKKCQKCVGFMQHQWRHSCNRCGCGVWDHDLSIDVNVNPLNIMHIEEEDTLLTNSEYADALSLGYLWLPIGVDSHTVDVFFGLLEEKNVPKVESEGGKHRMKQLLFQLPKQDFDLSSMKYLSEKGVASYKQFTKTRNEEILGIGVVNASVPQQMQCMKCLSMISEGEMAVFTEHFGSDSCWHPSCYTCCIDNKLLVDYVYFAYQKKLYCGRHFGEQIKPRCFACDELILVGKYVKAMDKIWHQEHFRCHFCDDILTKKKYALINNLPHCQICFNTKCAKMCNGCERLIGIESKDFYIKDRHYHEECLNCRLCKVSLANVVFSLINEQPICHQCRGIDPEKSKLCKICEVLFENDEKKLFIGNDYYHSKCFVCDDCKTPIGGQKFIKKSDGRYLCQECFRLTATVCGACDNYIKNTSVKFEGQSYHMECFICLSCKKQLVGAQFYKQFDDPYCESCFFLKFAKHCFGCLKPIEGNTIFVDYKNEVWHSKCFVCVKCNTLLAGEKFVLRNDSKYCIGCTKF